MPIKLRDFAQVQDGKYPAQPDAPDWLARTTRANEADWTILNDARVLDVLGRAAAAVQPPSDYSASVIDFEDVRHNGCIFLACNAVEARDKLARGEGYLYTWLKSRLSDSIKTERRRAAKAASYGVDVTELEPFLSDR